MDPRRTVLVHKRWRTVHELNADGTTPCGNGNSDDRSSYDEMKFNQVVKPRRCERCVWIVEPVARRW
jgi:hypothetical protein